MAEARRLHLSAAEQALVDALLARHLPGVVCLAYGSRVAGWPGHRVLKRHSDLDLALVGRPSDASLADLREALDNSALPWRVDVCLLDDLPDELRRLISDHGLAVRLPATV